MKLIACACPWQNDVKMVDIMSSSTEALRFTRKHYGSRIAIRKMVKLLGSLMSANQSSLLELYSGAAEPGIFHRPQPYSGHLTGIRDMSYTSEKVNRKFSCCNKKTRTFFENPFTCVHRSPINPLMVCEKNAIRFKAYVILSKKIPKHRLMPWGINVLGLLHSGMAPSCIWLHCQISMKCFNANPVCNKCSPRDVVIFDLQKYAHWMVERRE